MKRILFVDDEARVLEGLQNMLRRHRREWEMVFALGGAEALVQLERSAFDVVVTDMRMPGVDGAAVLTYVQTKYPETVRIVLSGYSELDATLRAVPLSHQFLAKPCDAETLRNVIERACKLQELIDDETVRRMIGQISKLPSLPRIYLALTKLLCDPETTVKEVAKLLEKDMGMCAKVLQLVNSAFFGLAKRTTSIEEAVVYLGFNMIKNLVLSIEVFRTARFVRFADFSILALQRHATFAANIARKLMKDRRQAEDAFMAAMLHDVGKLILATELPNYFESVLQKRQELPEPMHLIEEKLSGVSHAEVGAYLLGIWGLPYAIVEAVAHHHHPTRAHSRNFDIVTAVHVADSLAHEQASPALVAATMDCSAIDMEYLLSIGMADQLEQWRSLAAEAAVPWRELANE
ncbi:MAG: HDOD domain-containing protein [Cyanobacteria bacterium NC_groundwater_1444_Ag_S-0.65um_54_12]|nr:HDOD domain-containing protein [Cyanobacteria bacterium NC_groundwater_1444_Ag_S-0.65um_54_12]